MSLPERPLTNIGEGVTRRVEEDEPEEKSEEELAWEKDTGGKPKWFNEATLEDQMINPKYRNTWKQGPRIFRTFELPEQESELNALMARTVPSTGPQVIAPFVQPQSHEGKWSILVGYHEILYKKLLSTV